jgi:hypothetical protein
MKIGDKLCCTTCKYEWVPTHSGPCVCDSAYENWKPKALPGSEEAKAEANLRAEGEKMTKTFSPVYDFSDKKLILSGIINHIITSCNDTFLDQFDWGESYPVVDNEEDKRIIGISYEGEDCQGDIVDDDYIVAASTGGNYRGIGDDPNAEG